MTYEILGDPDGNSRERAAEEIQRDLQTLRNQVALGSSRDDGIRAPHGKSTRWVRPLHPKSLRKIPRRASGPNADTLCNRTAARGQYLRGLHERLQTSPALLVRFAPRVRFRVCTVSTPHRIIELWRPAAKQRTLIAENSDGLISPMEVVTRRFNYVAVPK